jgi:hypothetical protein
MKDVIDSVLDECGMGGKRGNKLTQDDLLTWVPIPTSTLAATWMRASGLQFYQPIQCKHFAPAVPHPPPFFRLLDAFNRAGIHFVC